MIESLCIAWRKGVRRVWLLPRDSANEIVYLIADVVPIFDEICRRAMNFISTCYQLGSELASYVINRGLYFEHMNSLIGCNAVSVLCVMVYLLTIYV